MDLVSHVRIFISIAKEGSLAGAARASEIAPSAVTASLQRLEEHLGVTLVERSSRRLALTLAGESFLQSSELIVAELDDAINQLNGEGPLKGTIRLTSINDFGRSRLPSLIDGFLEMHPQVTFDISLGDEVVGIIEGAYELGIRTGPLIDSRLMARMIVKAGRSVCASPKYWARNGKPTNPQQLMEHNCLVLSRRGHPVTNWAFQDKGSSVMVAVSGDRMTNDGGLLRQWAVDGVGVVLKSDYDVDQDIAQGLLESALDDYRIHDINLYAVHAAGRQPSRRVQAFIHYLRSRLVDQ